MTPVPESSKRRKVKPVPKFNIYYVKDGAEPVADVPPKGEWPIPESLGQNDAYVVMNGKFYEVQVTAKVSRRAKRKPAQPKAVASA